MTAENNVRRLLEQIGENTGREGLAETPRRYSRFLKEFIRPPELEFTTFDGEGYDEMVVQTNIVYYSLCEHHLLPFFGTGTIAYVPSARIVGLSKLARTLEYYSRGLQNQERITMQFAGRLSDELQPKGVAVLLHARHMCMEMRGVQKPGVISTTSSLTGVFKTHLATRQEFLTLARQPD